MTVLIPHNCWKNCIKHPKNNALLTGWFPNIFPIVANTSTNRNGGYGIKKTCDRHTVSTLHHIGGNLIKIRSVLFLFLFFDDTLTSNNTLFPCQQTCQSSLTVQSYSRQFNILTNRTTVLGVYSVLIPKD